MEPKEKQKMLFLNDLELTRIFDLLDKDVRNIRKELAEKTELEPEVKEIVLESIEARVKLLAYITQKMDE